MPDTNTVIPDGARHFLRSVGDADDVTCYVDGVPAGTDTDTSGIAAPAADGGDRPHASVWDVIVYEGAYALGAAGTGGDT